MSDTNFSDEPLDTQHDFDDWEPAPEFAPPPAAGTYRAYLAQIREEKEFEAKSGKRLSATVDFKIIGGTYDDRSVNWQRVSNAEFQRRDGRRTSFMLDLVKAAGVQQAPRSNREFSQVLHSLVDRGPSAPMAIQIDWRGFCTGCYEKSLMQATGASTVDAAKDKASNEQYNDANKYATKAKGYRGFPALPNGGGRSDSFLCKDCGNEVRAQVRVSRFLQVS